MEVLQNRLDSFVKQKRGKSLKWPHPNTWLATPETLAEAGFYFDPSTDDPDNATCFMCNKQVTEWAEDDDPFDIHWEKCAKVCAWANLRCGLRRDADSKGRYLFPDKSRLPISKAMEKARLETFAGQGWKWKHDKNKKHGATAKKMAHAGFVFTPTETGDDTGTCLYCEIALGNWDEDDDPMQQHRDRDKSSTPCPFLALAFDSAAPQPKPSKRATKPKPLLHTEVVMPTKTYDGSDDDASVPLPATVAKTPRNAASSSTAKTPRTTTRSLSRANLRDPDIPLYEDEAITPPPKKRGRVKSGSRTQLADSDKEGRPASPPPPTRQRRPTQAARSRSKSVSQPASVLEAANLFDDDDDDEPNEPQVPRKPSRSKSKAREVESDKAEEPAAPKPSRSKPKTREGETGVDDGLQPAEETLARKASRSKAKPKTAGDDKADAKRPSSRSQSKTQPPADGTSSDDGWFVAPLPPPPSARSRTKSVSRSKEKDQGTDPDEPVVVSRKEQKTKARNMAEESERDTTRPASRSQNDRPGAIAGHAVARKPSRTKSKPSVAEEPEVKKPPSRAKAKASPEPAAAEPEEDDEMEQYLPPPSAQRPPAVKSRSKPPSKVDESVEEPKASRPRKPSSRSVSKPVLPKFELAASVAAVQEEPQILEEHKASRTRKPSSRSAPKPTVHQFELVASTAEPVEEKAKELALAPLAPAATRARKTSNRSTTTAPVSRGTSVTAKTKANGTRDPTPSHDHLDLDMQTPDELDTPPVLVPLQLSRQPTSHAAGPSSLQAAGIQASASRKPRSKLSPSSPSPAKPRSMSHSQARTSKAKKDAKYYSEPEEHSGSGGEGDDGLPVVEISTDDEEPETMKAAPKVKGKGKGKKSVVEEIIARLPPSPVMDDRDDDVEMAEVEESMRVEREPDPLPITPPRAHVATVSSVRTDEGRNVMQGSPEGFAFVPPLASDPFLNLESLTEAEQDMTVEEWIRYQMGIEYERFKRDGERQLGMFEVRAEEVRRAIETL
ncbi:hypothetical protein B0H15DRAFT_939121 [Mycena belliarum]|uniref:BIR-domain-containing protein n=1 Tax=Mycena belliarum TaxID=1033014 RepID=A0AAD6U438_9AGAR|nr:hypothetical protein B0H15DRAFT_939121 [Mycena belliae]